MSKGLARRVGPFSSCDVSRSMRGMTAKLDLSQFHPPRTPNWFFVAPDGFAKNATPHQTAPIFPYSRDALWDRLLAVFAREPRITTHDQDKAAGYLACSQASFLFRFPDRIIVQILDGPKANQATLAILSRAVYGRRDLGVNKARVLRILHALAS